MLMSTRTPAPAPTPTPSPTATPEPTATPVPSPSRYVYWFDSPPDATHSTAKESIETIWAYDPELGERVSRFSWVRDEIIEREQLLLEEIAALTEAHPDLARKLLAFPWIGVYRGVTDAAPKGVAAIRLTADIDFDLGARLIESTWLQNGFSSNEADALEAIATLAAVSPDTAGLLASSDGFVSGSGLQHAARGTTQISGIFKESPALGETVASYPWVADGITRVEAHGLAVIREVLRAMTASDSGLAERLLGYHWIAAGVSASEVRGIDGFRILLGKSEELDSNLAGTLAGYDWIADGVTGKELEMLDLFEELLDIAGPANAGAVDRLAGYDWIADGVTDTEQEDLRAFRWLFEIAERLDANYLDKLMAFSWVGDGITREERGAIHLIGESMKAAGRGNSVLAEKLLDYSWLADGLDKRELDSLIIFVSLFETVRNLDSDIAGKIMSYPWVADGITSPEPDAINRFRDLIIAARETNSESASTIAGFRWVADGITTLENYVLYSFLIMFQISGPGNVYEVEELLSRPWVSDGVTSSEFGQIQRFQELLETGDATGTGIPDAPIAERVSEALRVLPWVADGITGEELNALNSLQALLNAAEEAKSGAAETLLDHGWVKDGVNPLELETLYIIRQLLEAAETDESALAETIVGFTWVADGLTSDENNSINSLRTLQRAAAKAHSGLAVEFAASAWVQDGLTDSEMIALHRFEELLKVSQAVGPETVEMLAGYPWIKDGINRVEKDTLHIFQTLIESAGTANSSFVLKVVGFPWVADGITVGEPDAINLLRDVLQSTASADPELAERWADYSWVADGLTHIELSLLRNFLALSNDAASTDPDALKSLDPWITGCTTVLLPEGRAGLSEFLQPSSSDLSILQYLLTAPWLEDGIVAGDAAIVQRVRDLVESFGAVNHLIGEKLAAYPWAPTGVTAFECRALNHLRNLLGDPDSALPGVPWFQDGLDDVELALIAVLRTTKARSEEQYQDLLDTHYVRSKTISLPLAGDIRLFVFRHSPFPGNDDSIELMEDIARHLEEFMGVPFPRDPVVVGIIEPSIRAGEKPQRGVGYALIDQLAITGREYNRGFDLAVFHEMSHLYWGGHTGAPAWFTEGAAGFLPDYARAELGRQSISARRLNLHQVWEDECRVWGAGTISRFLRMRDVDPDRYESRGICTYALGEFFLLETYQLFGKDAASAAMRQLYLEAEATGWTEPITEEQIYRIYKENAPRGKEDAFEAVYERYHGGTHD